MKILRNNKLDKKQQNRLLKINRNNNWQSRVLNKLFKRQPNRLLIIPNKLLNNQSNRPPHLSMSNQQSPILPTRLFRNNKVVRIVKLPSKHNITINLNRMFKLSKAKHKIKQKTISRSLNLNKHDFINIIGINFLVILFL